MRHKSSQKQQDRSARRRSRYAARQVLWSESHLPRVRACGLNAQGARLGRQTGEQVNVTERGGIAVRRTHDADGSRAGFSGVQSCGSVWSCPVCSEKIQAHRQGEVETALAEAHARGWVVAFITLTVRHSRAHSLRHVWGAVSNGWRAATSGSRAAWSWDKEEFGVVGYLRLTEVTHGAANGWHVHVHALVMLDPTKSHRGVLGDDGRLHLRDAQELGERMFSRWSRAVKASGKGLTPSRRNGLDVRLVLPESGLAEYFAKNTYAPVKSSSSAAHDVTSSHAKQAKRGNVTPFGILARLVADGDEVDLLLWREWEAASKGKRQLLWSNGLRADLGLVDEVEDQEVVDQEHGGHDLVVIEPKGYRRLAFAGLLARVLDLAEKPDDGHALCLLLAEHRIPWRLPDRPVEAA